jgi:hypothetical protein
MYDETRSKQAPTGDGVRVCRWCDAAVKWANGRWVHRFISDARGCGRPPVPVVRKESDGETTVGDPTATSGEAQGGAE